MCDVSLILELHMYFFVVVVMCFFDPKLGANLKGSKSIDKRLMRLLSFVFPHVAQKTAAKTTCATLALWNFLFNYLIYKQRFSIVN